MAIHFKTPPVPQFKLKKPNPFAQHLGPPQATKAVVDHLTTEIPVATTVVEHETKGIHATPPKVISQEDETMTTPGPMPEKDLCRVSVSGARTINLGNYESAKISVTLTLPCAKPEINDAFDFASEWVSDRIETTLKKAAKGN